MNEDYGTIWVCQDCMLHHANGECGGCHDGSHERARDERGRFTGGYRVSRPWSAVAFGDGFQVTMGLSWEEHADDCPVRIAQDHNADGAEYCECDRNTFSRSQCEGCGSWLHGERHAFHLWRDAPAESDHEYATTVHGLAVTVDKVGGGTLGRAYDGDWTVTVKNGDVIVFDNEILHTGLPKTHHQAAVLAAEFAADGDE